MTFADQSHDVLELSFELSSLTGDRTAFMKGAFEILDGMLPSEGTGWFSLDMAAQTADLMANPPEQASASYAEAFAATAESHPVYVDLLARPDYRGPRRLSDVTDIARFRQTPFYNEVVAGVGVTHNITFLLHPLTGGPLRAAGWSFWRRHDFSDDELELAGRIQPVLAALETLRRRPESDAATAALVEESRQRAGLTTRELDVLTLVADGLTATAIGRVRRISPATVRKHLEHAYAKLGVSDRLLAVTRARQLGLLTDSPFTPSQRGESPR